ncbi:hypothetical protein DKM44_12870 [Deinococcus irradiatisoli]|uniref:ATP-binding protein n=1 Tax=Deinococcus irradiatisoli TaxID=2202254 RepID=A0A2Z3JTU1_9DEIO|nr:ATP-binding protein [Deinococcus irradiatisoli]AWN24014.1 hypothetical protein DKM44_12870 [Deinococcus irradiatisoli]
MREKVEVTPRGIINSLRKVGPWEAISEYIWNGFDAGATQVDLVVEESELGSIKKIQITDNGSGIAYEELPQKFKKFLDSEKSIAGSSKISSSIHGKSGIGRMTFSVMATDVEWRTRFTSPEGNKAYTIRIDLKSLDKYEVKNPPTPSDKPTGTRVTISNIHTHMWREFSTVGIEYLKAEFAWFLELNKTKNYSLTVNGEKLNYESIIGSRYDFSGYTKDGTYYTGHYIQWSSKLNDEMSRYYFLKSDGQERFKETTSFNRKGDRYYHSIYITSDIFDNFSVTEDDTPGQESMMGFSRKSKQFHEIRETAEELLRERRRPYLKEATNKIIDILKRMRHSLDTIIAMYGRNIVMKN